MRLKTLEQITAQDFAVLQVDLLSKLRSGNLTFEQLRWFTNLQFEKREEMLGKKPVPKVLEILSILESISQFYVEALDGSETLVEANDVFSSIGKRFTEWETRSVSKPTEYTTLRLHKLKENATFMEMFESLGSGPSLALTQSQIKRFCKKYAKHLFKGGINTIFLPFELDGNYFIASVNPEHLPEEVKPSITLYPLNFNDKWVPDYGNSKKFNYIIVTA
ncbi:MAG: hypothetical protein K2X69_04600 [Silvanigrellaceae bacterium]|nr:hypothetical protein [Silvanigrellaceae bacterium]